MYDLQSTVEAGGDPLAALIGQVTRALAGVSDGAGQTALLADHQLNLSMLVTGASEPLARYLRTVQALLDRDEAEALGAFVADLASRLSGAGNATSAGRAFEAAMGRLASVRKLSAEAAVHVEVTVAARAEAQAAPEEADPLILDLSGDGIALTGAEGGALFDIDADGRQERISTVQGDDVFLALDRNGNGRVDDGRELFGDQTGAPNGFEALARHDANGDGRIDRADPVFERLRVYQDANRNGRTDDGELRRLDEAGVAAIGLSYRQTNERLASGDRLVQQGGFLRTDGSVGVAADAMVGVLDVRA